MPRPARGSAFSYQLRVIGGIFERIILSIWCKTVFRRYFAEGSHLMNPLRRNLDARAGPPAPEPAASPGCIVLNRNGL